MAYRYLALVNTAARDPAQAPGDVKQQLRATHMRELLETNLCTLYVSEGTPIIPIHEASFVIGHLFSKNGSPITHMAQLPALLSDAELRRHILERCWGAYLIVQLPRERGGEVCITRDPEGGVPCLYHLDGGTGFVTSDIDLAVHTGLYRESVDWDSILHRLIHPAIKSARTSLNDISELLPGTRLTAQGMNATIQSEWSPWDFVSHDRCPPAPQEAATAIRRAIDMAVKSWAAADRAVLLELSGGLDSSIVGAGLKGTGTEVTCCTLVTPIPGADERRYAGQIAALLGAKLHEEVLGFDSAPYEFKQLATTATPRVGMLQQATDLLMDAARRHHGATSFFSGGGGDTVFCYLPTAAPAADAFRQRGLASASRAVRNLAALHQCTIWKAGRLTFSKLIRTPRPFHNTATDFISSLHDSCEPQSHPWLNASDHALPGDRERIFALATTQVYRDSAPRGQRAHLRLPLLSQPVVEAALGIPSWMWISDGQNRAVARQAFANILPPDVVARRSKGSFIGYVGAVYARHKHQLRDFLLNGRLRSHGILDAQSLERFIGRELAPRDRRFERILDLCAVENWARQRA